MYNVLFNIEQYIISSSFKCPFNKEVNGCALHEIRSISDIRKRMEHIEDMTDEEKLGVYLGHKKCLRKRENK